MALYSGFLIGFGTRGPSSHVDLADLGNRDPIDNSQRNGEYAVPTPSGAAYTDNTPISSIPVARQGSLAPTFRTDWYGRVHIVPSTIELGNLLSSQVRNVEVWNGWFERKLLSEIQETNTDGIVLTEPEVPPTYFAELESRTYVLNISTNGSPVIAAEFLFNFGDDNPTLTVTGRRVVVWPFMAQTGHKEVLEWKTDIIPSFKNEQRIALRDKPRQAFTHKFQMDAYQLSRAKAIATQWSHRVYGIPVWAEATKVGAIPLGSTEVLFDTSNADYRDNDIILIWESDTKFLALENTEVLADRIVLKLPTEITFAEAYIAPLRFARTFSGIQFKTDSHPISIAEATFQVTENKDLGATMGLPVYRGADVLNEPTVVIGTLSSKISRSVDQFDNGSGPISVDLKSDWVTKTRTLTFDSLTRGNLWTYRKWLHSLRGKQKTFWVPSWNYDLEVIEDIGASSTSFTAKPIGYPLYYGVTDILLVTKAGDEYYRRILGGSTNEDGNEILNMNTSFGVAIPKSDVALITFIHHVRLDTDRISIEHKVGGRSTIVVPVTEVPE